jgi:hypothetical protein
MRTPRLKAIGLCEKNVMRGTSKQASPVFRITP